MKKRLLGLSLVLCMGCSSKSSGVGVATPFEQVSSMEEAESKSGFSLDFNSDYDYKIQVFDYGMIEVIFFDGSSEVYRIRKDKGVSDISGDYNSYEIVEEIDGVTYKGNGALISDALWNDGTYSYAIISDGLEKDVMYNLVSSVK